MKYSDKLSLLLKGVKMDEIKALEEQEQKEIADQAAADPSPELTQDPAAGNPDPEIKPDQDYKKLFEDANSIIKEMEEKLQQNQDELSKLKNEIAAFNNRQTQAETPDQPYDETAVFKELFNNKQKEE